MKIISYLRLARKDYIQFYFGKHIIDQNKAIFILDRKISLYNLFNSWFGYDTTYMQNIYGRKSDTNV